MERDTERQLDKCHEPREPLDKFGRESTSPLAPTIGVVVGGQGRGEVALDRIGDRVISMTTDKTPAHTTVGTYLMNQRKPTTSVLGAYGRLVLAMLAMLPVMLAMLSLEVALRSSQSLVRATSRSHRRVSRKAQRARESHPSRRGTGVQSVPTLASGVHRAGQHEVPQGHASTENGRLPDRQTPRDSTSRAQDGHHDGHEQPEHDGQQHEAKNSVRH